VPRASCTCLASSGIAHMVVTLDRLGWENRVGAAEAARYSQLKRAVGSYLLVAMRMPDLS